MSNPRARSGTILYHPAKPGHPDSEVAALARELMESLLTQGFGDFRLSGFSRTLLGGSWVVIRRAISRVTIFITHNKGLITPQKS